jgi:hypothetical protein
MVYTIKKGKHYSANWIGLLWRFLTGWNYTGEVIARCSFNPACATPVKEGDINKLLGLSCGMVHQNSARIGWRRYGKDRISLFAYSYYKGVRVVEWLGYVSPEERFKVGVKHDPEAATYTFTLYRRKQYRRWVSAFYEQEKEVVFSAPARKPLLYHKLYPYFGGTEAAPKQMQIRIN